MVLIIFAGFGIGALLALLISTPHRIPYGVAGTTSTVASEPMPVVAPTVKAVAPPMPPATAVAPAKSRIAATTLATAAPRKAATAALTTSAPLATAAAAALTGGATTAAGPDKWPQGRWRIDEANVRVGTIIWYGNAVLSDGNTIVLDAHKERVGGRSAMPCERHTDLHVALSVGVVEQTVPYHEVNCDGIASSGTVHVSTLSANTRAFSGSFWQGNMKLGNFDARQR